MVAIDLRRTGIQSDDTKALTDNVGFSVGLESRIKGDFGENKYKVTAILPYEFLIKPNSEEPHGIKAHIMHLTLLEVDNRDTGPIYRLVEQVLRQDPDSMHYFRMFLEQEENKVY